MESLPDDALIAVMQYLDLDDLLACRLACKRLSGVALHPDVWTHRELHYEAHRLGAMLRLAPRAHRLWATLPLPRKRRHLFLATKCAAFGLRLFVRGGAEEEAAVEDAVALIASQAKRGRLRHLDVMFGTTDHPFTLLNYIAFVSGLKKLEVWTVKQNPPTPAAGSFHMSAMSAALAASWPTLTEFHGPLYPWSEGFVNCVLSAHAGTLELLRLHLANTRACMSAAATAPLLARLKNLRSLTCCYIPGLEAVAEACAQLEHLRLVLGTGSGREHRLAAAGAAKLLSRAAGLRSVVLEYQPALSSVSDVGADLVLALALAHPGRPRPSRLERLSIENGGDGVGNVSADDSDSRHHLYVPQWAGTWSPPNPSAVFAPKAFPQMRALVKALPSLRALRQLEVTLPSDELLAVIRPDYCPALERLDVLLPLEQCAHSWFHKDAVKAVMAANPALHVKFEAMVMFCFGDARTCPGACAQGCHVELWDRILRGEPWEGLALGLFAHDPDKRCSLDHAADNWIHIPSMKFCAGKKSPAPV